MPPSDAPREELGGAGGRWPKAVVVIHWLSAATIVGLAAAGFTLSKLPDDSGARLLLSRLHTLGGFSLMGLTVARLFVRHRGPAPTAIPLPALHRRGVTAVHALLYAVVFGIGASGFATGAQSLWAQYLRGEVARAPSLEHMASREVHEALVFTLLGLVALHVGGVVIHQARAGGVLRRMLPFAR